MLLLHLHLFPAYTQLFFFYSYHHHRDLHSFPTRRSSDLWAPPPSACCSRCLRRWCRRRSTLPSSSTPCALCSRPAGAGPKRARRDRKSTRLNSSHLVISYAVFCLKKKKSRKHLTS